MDSFFQKAGRKFEKRITKEVGGSNTPGSGNQWHSPRDTVEKHFLIESKLTGQDHYVFELEDWFKHEQDAMKFGKMPVMVMGFFGGLEYAITHKSIWLQIVDNVDNYQLTIWKRRGIVCTRLKKTLLRNHVKRVPGSNQTNIVQFNIADEEFVIIPKQIFYYIKDILNEPRKTSDQED